MSDTIKQSSSNLVYEGVEITPEDLYHLIRMVMDHVLKIARVEKKISELENKNLALKKDLEMLKCTLAKQSNKEVPM